jgi:hypothetical protein
METAKPMSRHASEYTSMKSQKRFDGLRGASSA